jgi:tripartite-type tricarboxylate transporter receptor subunit TctC
MTMSVWPSWPLLPPPLFVSALPLLLPLSVLADGGGGSLSTAVIGAHLSLSPVMVPLGSEAADGGAIKVLAVATQERGRR